MFSAERRVRILLSAALLFFCISEKAHAATDPVAEVLREFIVKHPKVLSPGARFAVSVVNAESGENVFAYNAEESMIPASVLKLVTTAAALKILGSDYRFPTEIFIDNHPDSEEKGVTPGSVGNLYVRGYGDPSLVNEQVWNIASEVKSFGIKKIKNIVVDDTLFLDPPAATGSDPYRAALSATSVNFNSYSVTIAPSKIGLPAHVTVTPGDIFKVKPEILTVQGNNDEILINQNPESDGFQPRTKVDVGSGFESLMTSSVSLRLTGRIGIGSAPVTRYQTVPHPPTYFGSVLQHFLKSVGIEVTGIVLNYETPDAAKLLLTHQSDELAEMLRDLNQFSNNFIAGQLLYALGQEKGGRFRISVALEHIASLLEKIGIPRGSYEMHDGSGLDIKNRIKPEQLTKLLAAVYQDFSIAPDFIASLSRFGHSGTLRRRQLERDEFIPGVRVSPEERAANLLLADSVWGKTGTLDGVSTLAGYLPSRGEKRLAFAIIINGENSKDRASRLEEEIVRILLGLRKS